MITYDDKGQKTVYPSVKAYLERDSDFHAMTEEEHISLPFLEKGGDSDE